mmetsp:Transcript_3348/g.12159  ORF Transcript_3348/g.12159 Transcript_3348/m.12159 type:complete len:433 (-) Transcript_3348:55-1353(-)
MSRRAHELSAQRHVVAAAVWAARGHHRLARLASQALLDSNAPRASDADPDEDDFGDCEERAVDFAPPDVAVRLARANVALACLHGDSLAKQQMRRGKVRCAYVAALKKLHQRGAPADSSNVTAHCAARLLHEWALHRGALSKAKSLSSLLCAVSPCFSDLGAEAYVEAALRWLRYLFARKAFAEARRLLNLLLAFFEDHAGSLARRSAPASSGSNTASSRVTSELLLRSQHADALLLGAAIVVEACPHSPVAALPPLLRCLALCERFAMDAKHAECSMQLAGVHVRLGSLARARALTRAALPKVLEHASVEAHGDAWLILCECELLQAAHAQAKPRAAGQAPHSDASLADALRYLRSAISSYAYVEHREKLRRAYYLEARVCSQLPGAEMAAARNRAAADFLRLGKLLAGAAAEGGLAAEHSSPTIFDAVLG